MIPVVFGVILVVMVLLDNTPGDPARQLLGDNAEEWEIEEMHKQMDLDKPVLYRYGKLVWNLLHGDLGISYFTKSPVWGNIVMRFPYTLLIVTLSMILAMLIGIPIGVYAATHQYNWKDNASIFLSLFCVSMPNFWFALILVSIFAQKLRWLPPLGIETWKSWILPTVSLAIGYAASLARQTRSSMLEQIRQDYVVTARAKGQTERKVIYKHALKNALIPIITIVGSTFGMSLGGAVIAETIFSIPGLGSFTMSALTSRDYPTILGSVFYLATLFSVILLIVDIVYGLVDPRIRSQFIKSKRKKASAKNALAGAEAEG